MFRSKIVKHLFKQLCEKPIKSDSIDRVPRSHNKCIASDGAIPLEPDGTYCANL